MNHAVIGFVAGVGIGSVATYLYLKPKYEKIAQEEIDSYKETKNIQNKDLANKAMNKPDISEYEKIASTYSTFNNTTEPVEEEVSVKKNEEFRVISPEEFATSDGYDVVSYTLYVDGVLMDEVDEVVEDSDILNIDIAKHMNEYEEGIVYIRNDRLMMDYEISMDYRTYDEFINKYPEKTLAVTRLEDADEE